MAWSAVAWALHFARATNILTWLIYEKLARRMREREGVYGDDDIVNGTERRRNELG